MDANEQFVRERWKLIHCCDGSYRGSPRGSVLIQDIHSHWLDFDSWTAAAEFTRQRLEEIRQVEEEIAILNEGLSVITLPQDEKYAMPLTRIVAREQELLATLKRGLRASFDREGSVGK